MSLDVSLIEEKTIERIGTGIFVRENGKNREITLDEVRERWPEAKIVPEKYHTNEVYSDNITHNLSLMARKADIYFALWRPDEKGWTHAKDIISKLEKGLALLKEKPEYYKQFDASNGWGTYIHFVPFVENYLKACKKYPDAVISVDR